MRGGFPSLLLFPLFVFLTQPAPITGQTLTAEYLDIKLPVKNPCYAPFYDGDDIIYLFGGCQSPHFRILKFSISSETLETLVGNLPGPSYYGTVQSDSLGNMFYFGGYNGSNFNEVHKFNPTTNTARTVANLPYSISRHISMKYNDSSDTVFILGGSNQGLEMLAFSMTTHNYSRVPLPFDVYQGTSFQVGNKAFIFHTILNPTRTDLLELDLDTFDLKQVGPPTFPISSSDPVAVWDGQFGYIIGGYNSTSGDNGGILQVNPWTFEHNFIPVNDFLVEGSSHFINAPDSVFVPNKNRIYCFGGRSDNTSQNIYHDEIFYIDLTPLDPTPSTTYAPPTTPTTESTSTTLNPQLFSCNNRTNGLYPHPSDCFLFIGCQDEEMTIFSCPSDLLFDPVNLICNFPEEVECGTSCIDRPDGTYFHPHDCALYILCRSGSSTVVRCPPPLLFNPETLHCDFPDSVLCSATE